jgi:3-methyl-2-oxobutanoate hydroxymethyltransferase
MNDKAASIKAMKGRERIAALTAYDYPMAKILDAAGIPLILVGDSLGMVVLGYPDTTHVTMADMEHHVRAAARAKTKGLLAADLPHRSCLTPADAVVNARRLVAAGAEAVKGEGGRTIAPQARAIVDAGIPFLGHIGMLPQNAVAEGGYHVKGKSHAERAGLLDDAAALVDAGAFAIVLELVLSDLAAEITRSIPIPTIGIGAGTDCDGEILVTLDLFGLSDFIPRHVRKHWAFGEQMRAAAVEWKKSVLDGKKQHEETFSP